MARKRKTQPATLPELDKPAPFVPKLKDVTEVAPITSPGRPSEYNGEGTCKLARNMARAGLSHTMMARIFGIAPSTFSLWKAQHPAFLKALEQGTEQVDKALETTAIQRALGYSYETEKAFQTGVRMTVTETMPPDPNMLKFLMERRMEAYRPTKEVVHTHNAGALFQAFLRRMDERAKLQQLPAPLIKDAITIEPDPEPAVSPVLAQDDEPLDNQGVDGDVIS